MYSSKRRKTAYAFSYLLMDPGIRMPDTGVLNSKAGQFEMPDTSFNIPPQTSNFKRLNLCLFAWGRLAPSSIHSALSAIRLKRLARLIE